MKVYLLLLCIVCSHSIAKPVVADLHANSTIVGVEFRNIQLQFMISRDLPAVQSSDIRWFFQRIGDSVTNKYYTSRQYPLQPHN